MHILSSTQFTKKSITNLLKQIDNMCDLDLALARQEVTGKQLATVFFEPSTRTRLSFESAFLKLGGQVLSVENGFDSSSNKKGESYQDCIKTISQYVDLIVFRHPDMGSAEKAAEVSDCPVINAGDGAGEHPTQSIIDLYTIYKEKQTLDGLKIGIVGDLQRARTIRSLVNCLELFDVEIKMNEILSIDKSFDYSDFDVIYMTRIQGERPSKHLFGTSPDTLPFDPEKIKKDAIVLHPLPRNSELPVSFDSDPRACYFKQVKNGVKVRQVLMLAALNHPYYHI